MTPTEIRAAGYVVEQYYPTGADAETRRAPWVIRRLGFDCEFGRFATRREAVAELEFNLTSPDRTWP